MVLTLLGVSLLVERLVAFWSNSVDGNLVEDWAYVLTTNKHRNAFKGEDDGFGSLVLGGEARNLARKIA